MKIKSSWLRHVKSMESNRMPKIMVDLEKKIDENYWGDL
jgi:hypothetical protein